MGTDKKSTEQMTVTISFKRKEKWLYDEINKHGCMSTWIKEVIVAAEFPDSNHYNKNNVKFDNEEIPSFSDVILKGLLG